MVKDLVAKDFGNILRKLIEHIKLFGGNLGNNRLGDFINISRVLQQYPTTWLTSFRKNVAKILSINLDALIYRQKFSLGNHFEKTTDIRNPYLIIISFPATTNTKPKHQ